MHDKLRLIMKCGSIIKGQVGQNNELQYHDQEINMPTMTMLLHRWSMECAPSKSRRPSKVLS